MIGRVVQRDLGEVLRDEFLRRERLVEVLRSGPRTIPELARVLEAPAAEVSKWVMAMRRYGRVRDLPKAREDDYYRYELVEARP